MKLREKERWLGPRDGLIRSPPPPPPKKKKNKKKKKKQTNKKQTNKEKQKKTKTKNNTKKNKKPQKTKKQKTTKTTTTTKTTQKITTTNKHKTSARRRFSFKGLYHRSSAGGFSAFVSAFNIQAYNPLGRRYENLLLVLGSRLALSLSTTNMVHLFVYGENLSQFRQTLKKLSP